MFEVEVRNVPGRPLAIGSAAGHTLVVDRPTEGGGDGLGFNGGELLYLAIAGCVSNDLFREARVQGIELASVSVRVRGDFSGDPAVSDPVEYEVAIEGNATPDRLHALVDHVDRIAEIPNTLREGTQVRLRGAEVSQADASSRR
jgi:putative redox protein